jgi:hypothetical protein
MILVYKPEIDDRKLFAFYSLSTEEKLTWLENVNTLLRLCQRTLGITIMSIYQYEDQNKHTSSGMGSW